MERLTNPEASLTEAQRRSGATVTIKRVDVSFSNARHVPYAETYRLSTGLQETPVERIQRAAEDEAARGGD